MTAIVQANPVKSLAARSRQHLLYLGIAIFIGLIVLVTVFSFYQVANAGKYYMYLDAIKLEQQVSNNPNYELPQQDNFSAYRNWEDIPPAKRALFSESMIQPTDPMQVESINDQGIREYGYLLYTNDQQSGGLYLLEFEEADKFDSLAREIFKQALIDASLLAGLFSIAMFLVVSFLFNNAIKPLKLLVDWSIRVKGDPDNETHVQFPISELNKIADHLLAALQQVRVYNERERQFLRHASHELRTPLATIQASLDTMKVRTAPNSPNYLSLQRASRASANMLLLSEALLWLARLPTNPIDQSTVRPGMLCRELLEDMHHMVESKEVQVSIDDQSGIIRIEKDMLRIVMANLIRNALQHTASGVISIMITSRSFTVVNSVDTENRGESVGFGLGLQLVDRIANRLGWHFALSFDNQKALVELRW